VQTGEEDDCVILDLLDRQRWTNNYVMRYADQVADVSTSSRCPATAEIITR